MEEFFIYILKSATCFCVFYIFVKAFLSNDTFFPVNRVVILIGVFICIAIPFIELELEQTTFIHTPIIELKNAMESEAYLEQTVIDVVETEIPEEYINDTARNISSISWVSVSLVVYILGLFFNALLLLRSYKTMRKVIDKSYKQPYGKYILVLTDSNIVPFSWLQYIVISRMDYEQNADEILIHEIAHIKYKHTYDNYIMELISLFQWFNPAVWLLKRELKDVHEYQADMLVLESGLVDATKYQLLLVKKAVGASSYTLANSFNHSKIKKRITMMLKEKSNKRVLLKPVLLLPMCAFAVYAFAKTNTVKVESTSDGEVTKITSESEISLSDKDETYFFPLPTIKKISSPYGTKGSKFHRGYDMRGTGGDTIYAMADGVVTRSDYDDAWGNAVFLRHDNNIESIYAHNSKNLVKKDNRVNRGQPIAIIGNTGKSTGEHLHFEVRKDGEAINALTKYKFYSARSLKGIVPPPPPPLPERYIKKDGKTQSFDIEKHKEYTRGVVKKNWDAQNYSKDKERIGEESDGKFNIRSFSYTGEPESSQFSTVFPESYNKRDDGVEKNYLRIHYYVVAGKKYLRSKFLSKFENGKVFLQKEKILPEDGEVTEVSGITTDGAKTPVFYMTMKK